MFYGTARGFMEGAELGLAPNTDNLPSMFAESRWSDS